MQNEGPLTVFGDQLPVGGKWEMWSLHPLPFPSSRSHSHSHSHSRETSLAIPIPMGFPWDPRDPWEFPYYAHLYLFLSKPTGSEQQYLVPFLSSQTHHVSCRRALIMNVWIKKNIDTSDPLAVMFIWQDSYITKMTPSKRSRTDLVIGLWSEFVSTSTRVGLQVSTCSGYVWCLVNTQTDSFWPLYY